jgi:DNA-binding LytR/AlgR family response regulator
MLRILIIEDELPNAGILKAHLKQFSPDALVSGPLRSNREILDWIPLNPRQDLVFCDIRLLDGDVFESLNLGIISSPVIFTTAYNDFFQEAFDANCIAYLLKPIGYQRFATAMQKFSSLQESFRIQNWDLISAIVKQKKQIFRERIVVKSSTGFILLPVQHICCISSQEGKCTALDAGGKSHVFRSKISEMAEELDPSKFFLINRGEIVNLDYIEHIEPYFGDRLAIRVRHNPMALITSTTLTPAFRQWIDG